MEAAALFDAVTKCLPPDTDSGELKYLLGRLPKEHYSEFPPFFHRIAEENGCGDLPLLADAISRFNDRLIDAGNTEEVIGDLEEKLGRLAPTLIGLGLFSTTPPVLSWAIVQNHYRIVADDRMLLFDFTKTEFELIQRVKLDRAVRLVHRDAGEFMPYVKSILTTRAY